MLDEPKPRVEDTNADAFAALAARGEGGAVVMLDLLAFEPDGDPLSQALPR